MSDGKLRAKALWCRLMGHPLEPVGEPYYVGGQRVHPHRCWCGYLFATYDDQGRRAYLARRPS